MRTRAMKPKPTSFIAALFIAGTFATPMVAQAATGNPSDQSFTASLQPMNAKATGFSTTGKATFNIHGDILTIDIMIQGAPPNITHWQHFHGLQGQLGATCAAPAADVNGDGFVDLIETEPASGTTMVPFDDMPAKMDVAHGEYPKASADGSYHYQKDVSVKALSAAFAKAFNGQALNLDQRVLLIHGVADDTKLPTTVKSLGPIPAHVTLPIACGKIQQAAQ